MGRMEGRERRLLFGENKGDETFLTDNVVKVYAKH